jgi:hypothetical protein
MIYPVDNLDDAYNACHPDKPLKIGDPRYLDLKGLCLKYKLRFVRHLINREKP